MFSHVRRLSWSGTKLGYDINIAGLVDRNVDLGVPGASALLELVDSFTSGQTEAQTKSRTVAIAQLGEQAFFDSATVFGNFEMMNRVAEGTGIPIPPQAVEREAGMIRALGLYDIFKSQQS